MFEILLFISMYRNTAAEIRKRAIQESKFLGGDMEHTHLVKGLDFALLQKVNVPKIKYHNLRLLSNRSFDNFRCAARLPLKNM